MPWVVSTKGGGDMHRGMGQRSETRVSKGKIAKKKNILGADRGCSVAGATWQECKVAK